MKEPVSYGFAPGALDDYHEMFEKYDFITWIYSTSQNKVFIMSELLSKDDIKTIVMIEMGPAA